MTVSGVCPGVRETIMQMIAGAIVILAAAVLSLAAVLTSNTANVSPLWVVAGAVGTFGVLVLAAGIRDRR